MLALVWLFLGYFGFFDPGISRAASFHIARLHADEHADERESVFWTALLINLGFGLAGGIIAYVAARPLFTSSFKMPEPCAARSSMPCHGSPRPCLFPSLAAC